ncbi:MAG: Efflux transporter, RND family, MFP subunit [Candidatus Uhrbacteria bacterium GW2011_GWA2_41_10]|nr:MAG: Efflux transporter, RND family, MFP subunit [Candidatus Uhrbacteria bacterium GW2011_GWA2_41_10]
MDTAETSVYGLEATSDPSAIETSAGLVQTVLDDVAVTLLYTREALDATTSDSATFTAAELSALKAKIDTAREDIQKQNDKLLTQEQTIASLEISTNTDEDTAKNKVTELTQSVSSVKTEQASKMAKAEAVVSAATAAVEVGKADVEQKQMKLAEVQASPRSVDLAALQAAVEESRSALAIAEARMSKARLVSPLTGKVTDVAFDVGEQPGVRQTVVTIQTAQNQFKLVVDVPESDITKVSLNDKVDLTFDAFGDDVHVAGIVGLIDPAEKTVEGVVYYEVTVYLVDPNTSLNLKSGMTLDAAIVTAQVDNVLTIPQRAVLERVDGTKYVRVLTGETTYDERTVTLGLHGDEGKVEVVSGLNEGDKAILTIRPAK